MKPFQAPSVPREPFLTSSSPLCNCSLLALCDFPFQMNCEDTETEAGHIFTFLAEHNAGP